MTTNRNLSNILIRLKLQLLYTHTYNKTLKRRHILEIIRRYYGEKSKISNRIVLRSYPHSPVLVIEITA